MLFLRKKNPVLMQVLAFCKRLIIILFGGESNELHEKTDNFI